MSTLEPPAAVAAWCRECDCAFYVIDEPEHCPYCGGVSVAPEYAVVVRPE